jgi:hypothetical protein
MTPTMNAITPVTVRAVEIFTTHETTRSTTVD